MLEQKFEKNGDILSAKVSLNEDYKSNGYGYVTFFAEAAAAKAAEQKDVEIYKKPDFSDSSIKGMSLYVKNFPKPNWTEEEMKKLFGVYGTILSVMISKDSKGNPIGFGFVNYE